jgi:hypothetical protein
MVKAEWKVHKCCEPELQAILHGFLNSNKVFIYGSRKELNRNIDNLLNYLKKEDRIYGNNH